jgi:LuxR family maltose regulon positive regulatory protein
LQEITIHQLGREKSMRHDSGSALGGALQPPELDEPLVERAALVARLDAATQGALSVLVAPCGWGKSVLVAQWALRHLGAVSWVTFDPRHSSAAVATLLTSAVAALGIAPRSRNARTLTQDFRRELLDDLDRLDVGYLVLEGVDRLDADVRDDLGRLIEAAPPHVHFLVTTRADVLFPASIARLAMRDDVAFLRRADLAFDRVDAQRILQDATEQHVDLDAVDRAIARTDGWPGAFRILANSLHDTKDVHRTIDAFTGDDPHLRGYFDAEMLAPLPGPVRTFVLETSVPDRVTPELCRALTERDDCSATLDLLGRYGLVERDAGGEWWQYQSLVREMLLIELREAMPAAEAHLLRVAAAWHAECGTLDDLEAAARYATRAQDWGFVHLLARRNGRRMHEAARVNVLLRWIDGVPEPVRRADVNLGMMEVAVLTIAGRASRAEQVLRTVEETHHVSPGRSVAVSLARSVWVDDHLSPSLARAAAEHALDGLRSLPPDDLRSIGDIVTPQNIGTIAAITRARANWYLGEVTPARRDLFDHMEAGDTSPLSRLHLFGGIALLESWNGVLTLAEHFAVQARRVANESLVPDHPYVTPAELALAHVAVERGHTDEAVDRLDRAAVLMRTVTHTAWETMLALERAWLALIDGRPRDGLDALTADTTESPLRPLFDGRRRALRARLLLALDDVAGAEHALAYDPTTAVTDVAAVATQLALVRGDVDTARQVLDVWPDDRAEQDRLARAYWTALVAFAAGDRAGALAASEMIIEVGGAGQHVRALLDAGPVAQPFLAALARHDATGYIASVLAVQPRATGDDDDTLADDSPLTRRERAVLRRLANRLTYQEIAEELYISRNTVKSHAKSVYMKLGASGRRDAVQRAEQLGLL